MEVHFLRDPGGCSLADCCASVITKGLNGDGTITGNNTKLMWAKKSDDGTIHDKDNSYTWANAFAVHIATLNSTNFAGHNDWR